MTKSGDSKNTLYCSFCGKSQAEVKKIIAGPGVYICDSCVNVCKTIIDREVKTPAVDARPSFRLVKPGEIKKLLVLQQVPKPVNFSGGMEPLTIVQDGSPAFTAGSTLLLKVTVPGTSEAP